MAVLDSFPFSDVTLIQDETVKSVPSRNESPLSEIPLGSPADSAKDVAALVEDTGKPASSISQFLRCEKCQYQTKIKSLLHKHIAKHLLDSDFQCSVCDFRESNGDLFVDHFSTHHNGATLKCPICHRKFRKSDLKAHIMTHKAVTLYDCSMCEFSTNYVKSIKSHSEAFHNKVYKCRHCSLGFTKHELQLHIKSVHESEHFSSELVSESFESVSSSSRGNNEIPVSSSETAYSGNPGGVPFSCYHCGFSTTYSQNLKRHTEAWHTKEYQCTNCNRVMPKHDLLQHMKALHALDDSCTNPNQNPVGISNQGLQTIENPSHDSDIEVSKAATRKSLRTTKGLRSNSYQYSSKGALTTASTDTLQATEKYQKPSLAHSHSSVKHPIYCSLCDFSSKSNRDIRRHTEAWHGKKHLCKECNQMMSKHDLCLHKESSHGLQGSSSNPSQDSGKDASKYLTRCGFKTSKNYPKSSLVNTQTSDKHQYCCSFCDYSSKFSGNLKRHTETMHDKNYLCERCNQVMSKHDLLRHKESSYCFQRSSSNSNQDSDKGAPPTKSNLNTSENDPKSSSERREEESSSKSLDKRPYCCPLCNYSTINKRNLTRHTEAFHEKEHHCEKCNQVMFKHELLLHMLVSHDLLPSSSTPNQVPGIDATRSPPKNSLKNDSQHATNSPSSNNIPYSCHLCKFSSTNQGIFKRHAEAWHDNEYHCEECNRVMSKHDLQLHTEALHGGICKGLQFTENTPAESSALCDQLKHDHSYVNTLERSQIPSSVSRASDEIQSLEIVENIPKSLPKSQDQTHSAGSSQRPSLEIGPFSFHKFRTNFSPEHTNAIGDSYSTGHLQNSVEVDVDSSNTSTNEPHTQQTEPSRRRCEFCRVTYAESYFIKHVKQCATHLIPDELGDDSKFDQNASENIPQNLVARTQQVASGFSRLRPDRIKLGKLFVVLERLKLDSSKLKSAITSKSRLQIQKNGFGLANGGNPKEPMLHCSECVFKTKRRKLLKKHVAKHLKDLRLKCPYCGYKEESTSMFVKHISEHQGDETTFKCCFCDSKPFRYRHSLGDHLWKHRPTTLLDCSKCKFSTFRTDVLRHHMENIHVKKYRCRVCGATMNRFRLGKHVGKVHEPTMKLDSHSTLLPLVEQLDLENQSLDSNRKNLTTNTSSLFVAHHTYPDQAKDLEHQTFANSEEAKPVSETSVLEQFKGSDLTPESCTLAGSGNVEILARENDLLKQIPCVSLRNLSITPVQQIDPKESLEKLVEPYFRCSKCSFKTRVKFLLKRHVAKHLIDDQFYCTKCDFKESCNRKFARHWFSHNAGSQQMIECCFCPAQYKKQSCLKGSLPWHIERHRVVQLFDCSKCEFSGSDKYVLERHHQKYHSKQHCCKVCGKFMTLNHLSKHACQSTNFRLEETNLSEPVLYRPCNLEQSENRRLRTNAPGGARDIIPEIFENCLTPKVYSGHEFTKPSFSLLVPPQEISCTAKASLSMNEDITLNQSDTSIPLAIPCDMDDEYFCIVCKSWISLDHFAIHQQHCSNTIDSRLAAMDEAYACDANTEIESVDVSSLSFFDESSETTFERNKANNSRSVELADLEVSETALGIEPLSSADFGNPGSKVAVPKNPKSKINSADKDVVELISNTDVTNTESDVQITTMFNSGDVIINLSSDSEDSYGSPYCDSELVGEDNSAPVFYFTNTIQDRMKNLLKLPNIDDVLPLGQSRNSENPVSSEQSHGKHQLDNLRWIDSTHGNDHLSSDVRNSPVLQSGGAGSQSHAEKCHPDMTNPVDPGNESILSIPSDSAVAGLFGQPKWRNVPISVARTRSESLPSVSGATGNVSSWQKQSLNRIASSSICQYPEIGSPQSGSDGRNQMLPCTSQPSSDPSKDDVPVWRFADGQCIVSRYVRNTSNTKTPSTVPYQHLTDGNTPMKKN